MNRTITVNVVKEFARQDSQNGGIQGSGNVDHLRLRFSEDWDGYAKTCVFWDANGENPVKVIVGADKLEDVTKDPRTYIIDIPPEPLAVEGTYTVVIDGYLDGKRGRSETIRLKSNGAQIADDAGEPADPTPSQAEQLQQEIEKIIPNIQSVATEAKSWAVGGTGSRDGEDTDNAKYYAQQSEKSAQESAQGLENISQQVEAAKGYSESAKTESLHAANRAQNAAESERSALESSESAKTAESNAKISEQSSAESARQSEEARQAIENMTASAVSVGPDAEPYVKKTSSGGVVNLEFGLRDGEPGPPGYTVPADGLYAFHIDKNGDLIITYTGDEVPPFSIDEDGDLIYTLDGNEVNLGHVVGGDGGGGTTDYNLLLNKPSINGIPLQGNLTTEQLGVRDGQDGEPGDPGQAATIEIVETETVAPDTPAAMVELPESTPQARRYKAQVPQGIQGPAGLGVPPISGPEDAGKVPVANPEGTGWLLTKISGGFEWTLIASVTLNEPVSTVKVSSDDEGAIFSCDAVIIRQLTTCEKTSRQNMTVYVNGKAVFGNLSIIKNVGYYGPADISIYPINGLLFPICVYSDNATTSAEINYGTLPYYNTGIFGGVFSSNVPVVTADKISEIRLACSDSSVKFGVGSVFKIYGGKRT